MASAFENHQIEMNGRVYRVCLLRSTGRPMLVGRLTGSGERFLNMDGPTARALIAKARQAK